MNRILRRGDGLALAMAAVCLTMVVLFAVLLDIPQVMGVSAGWSWTLGNRGGTTYRALTSKIAGFGPWSIFVGEGEVLEVEFDLGVQGGNASAYVSGPGRPGETLWGVPSVRAPWRGSRRMTASETGLHSVRVNINKTSGTFILRWRVHEPRLGPQLLRAGFSLLYLLPLLFLGLVGIALVMAMAKWIGDFD